MKQFTQGPGRVMCHRYLQEEGMGRLPPLANRRKPRQCVSMLKLSRTACDAGSTQTVSDNGQEGGSVLP